MSAALGNERLEAYLSETLGRAVRLAAAERLSGGAIQDNWRLVLASPAGEPMRPLVLRRDAPAGIGESRSRAEEFALIEAAWRAGVTVPEPVAFCHDHDIVGGPFALMAFVEGTGYGPRVVRDTTLGGDRERLAERLGAELARIHAIPIDCPALAFLGPPAPDPAGRDIGRMRAALDAMGAARPALEWGLRWAELHAPPPSGIALTHRDFRTGNYLVGASGLGAILDWEFADWGDPMADLGWFCAACWRFSRPDLEAGGIGSRAAFYRGYEAEAGAVVDDGAVRFWEMMAHARWAVIALQQGERHSSGREPSLHLALTGRIAAELELALLRATAPPVWTAEHAHA